MASYVDEFDDLMGDAGGAPGVARGTAEGAAAMPKTEAPPAATTSAVAQEIWRRQDDVVVQKLLLSKDEKESLASADYYVKHYCLEDSRSPATRRWGGKDTKVYIKDEGHDVTVVYVGATVTAHTLEREEFEMKHLSWVKFKESHCPSEEEFTDIYDDFFPAMCFQPSADPEDVIFVGLKQGFLEKLVMLIYYDAAVAPGCNNRITLKMDGKPCVVPLLYWKFLKKKALVRARAANSGTGGPPPPGVGAARASSKRSGRDAADVVDAKPASLREPGDIAPKRVPTNLSEIYHSGAQAKHLDAAADRAGNSAGAGSDADDSDADSDDDLFGDDEGDPDHIVITRRAWNEEMSEAERIMGEKIVEQDGFVVDDEEEEYDEKALARLPKAERDVELGKRALREAKRRRKQAKREADEQVFGPFNIREIANALRARRHRGSPIEPFKHVMIGGTRDPTTQRPALERVLACLDDFNDPVLKKQNDASLAKTAFSVKVDNVLSRLMNANHSAMQKVADLVGALATESPIDVDAADTQPRPTKKRKMDGDSDYDDEELVREALGGARPEAPPSKPNSAPPPAAADTGAGDAAKRRAELDAKIKKSEADMEQSKKAREDALKRAADMDKERTKASDNVTAIAKAIADLEADSAVDEKTVVRLNKEIHRVRSEAAAANDNYARLKKECDRLLAERAQIDAECGARNRKMPSNPDAAADEPEDKEAAPPPRKKVKRSGADNSHFDDDLLVAMADRGALYRYIGEQIDENVKKMRAENGDKAITALDRKIKKHGLLPPVTVTYEKYKQPERVLMRPAACYLIKTPEFLPHIIKGENLGTSPNILKRLNTFIEDKRAALDKDWLDFVRGVHAEEGNKGIAPMAEVIANLVLVCTFLVFKSEALAPRPSSPSPAASEDKPAALDDFDDDI